MKLCALFEKRYKFIKYERVYFTGNIEGFKLQRRGNVTTESLGGVQTKIGCVKPLFATGEVTEVKFP